MGKLRDFLLGRPSHEEPGAKYATLPKHPPIPPNADWIDIAEQQRRDISALDGRLTRAERLLDSHEGRIGDIGSQVDIFRAEQLHQGQQVDAMTRAIDANSARLRSMDDRLGDVVDKVSTLVLTAEGKVGKELQATRDGMGDLTSTVLDLAATVNALKSNVVGLVSALDGCRLLPKGGAHE
jgi:chromosome segregation ATPase